MKNAVLLLLFALFASSTTFAQDTLRIDFKDLQPEYKMYPANKSKIVVIIRNINRNLYKIDGAKTETDYNTTIPTALTGIKLPAYLYETMPEKANFAHSSEAEGDKTSTDLIAEIKRKLDEISQNAKKLDESTLLYNDINHSAKNCNDDQSTISNSVITKVNAYTNGSSSVSNAPQDLGNYLDNLISSSSTALAELNTQIQLLESNGPKELAAGHAKYVQNLAKSENDYKAAQKQKLTSEKLAQARGQYLSDKEKVDQYENDKKALSASIDQIKQNFTKAQSTVEDMRKFKRDDKIYAIVRQVQLLTNPATFTYTSETMVAKTDELKYTLTIDPTELNTCNLGGKKIITVTVKPKGGLKIDFSTGAFVNFGNDDFVGRSYYYQNIDANSRQIVTADRGSRSLLSVGALMHLYKRSPSLVKLGASAGVSLSTGLTDLNFHAGPSLIIGGQNRIILTGGLTLKSSSLLDQKLATNTTYTKLQSPDAIPTVSVFPTAGAFVALTYNFTSLTKK